MDADDKDDKTEGAGYEELLSAVAVMQGAYIVLVRYLAQENQVHIDELCDDLDALCLSNPDKNWQYQVMMLTEGIRAFAGEPDSH